MNKETLNKRIQHLQCFKELRKKDRLKVVDICSDECIHAICETCYNILEDAIPMDRRKKNKVKSQLMPLRFHIRKLADPKVSIKEKKGVLKNPQVGEGIFTILASTVLPALISALASK